MRLDGEVDRMCLGVDQILEVCEEAEQRVACIFRLVNNV